MYNFLAKKRKISVLEANREDDRKIDEALLEAISSLVKKESKEIDESLFGSVVVQSLEKLEPKKRATAKLEIQQILFKHEMSD